MRYTPDYINDGNPYMEYGYKVAHEILVESGKTPNAQGKYEIDESVLRAMLVKAALTGLRDDIAKVDAPEKELNLPDKPKNRKGWLDRFFGRFSV